MIETLDGLPDGVDGFGPVGQISVADYERVVVPVLDRADTDRRRLRLLCVVDPAFTGLRSAPSFRGWQNLRSLVRHVAFVAGHHRRIRRVAMAVDGRIGAWAPAVADRALHPEVRHFRHADDAAAIDWAAGPAQP